MASTQKLADAVEKHSRPLEGVVTALKTQPHTAQASAALTVEQAKQLFIAAHENLSDDELNEAVAFWHSPAGSKERELTATATNNFRNGRRNPIPLEKADPERVSLARKLVEMANIAEILGGFAGPFQMKPADVENYLIMEYATSATKGELEAMLAFYRSPTGTKVISASKTGAASLGKQVGL